MDEPKTENLNNEHVYRIVTEKPTNPHKEFIKNIHAYAHKITRLPKKHK